MFIDSWISNIVYGGIIYYYELNVLLVCILNFVEVIDEELLYFFLWVYSIDIGIVFSGWIWVYEFNIMFGIVWNVSC